MPQAPATSPEPRQHVFVETNWVFGHIAPEPYRDLEASNLLDRARRGEVVLHLPALSLVEARHVIPHRIKPGREAKVIRNFLTWGRQRATISPADREATLRVLSQFESGVERALQGLDANLTEIRQTPNVDIFALDDRMLEMSLRLGELGLVLNPFDQAILAGVLGRADELREQGETNFSFCELDSDLQPWDTSGSLKLPLKHLYDERGIWVYGSFDMLVPPRPAGWPGAPRGSPTP